MLLIGHLEITNIWHGKRNNYQHHVFPECCFVLVPTVAIIFTISLREPLLLPNTFATLMPSCCKIHSGGWQQHWQLYCDLIEMRIVIVSPISAGPVWVVSRQGRAPCPPRGPRIRGLGWRLRSNMPNMTGRPGYRTMEMNGGSSASYLARTPCVPLVLSFVSKGWKQKAF